MYYWLGLDDDGTPHGISDSEMEETLGILYYMAKSQDARIDLLEVRKGYHGVIANLKVRRNCI